LIDEAMLSGFWDTCLEEDVYLDVHLWIATQDYRDYHVFYALEYFQCSLMTL
jgi:hypothetical protein